MSVPCELEDMSRFDSGLPFTTTYCLHCFPVGNADIRQTELSTEVPYHNNFNIVVLDLFPASGSCGREKFFFEAKISMKIWSNEI